MKQANSVHSDNVALNDKNSTSIKENCSSDHKQTPQTAQPCSLILAFADHMLVVSIDPTYRQ